MRTLIPMAAALALALPGLPAAAQPKVGQLLECRSGDGAYVITLVVGKVDTGEETIVSVSVFNDDPATTHADVGHFPFAVEALELGCTPKPGKRTLSDKFDTGYGIWREAYDKGEASAFVDAPGDVYVEILAIAPPSPPKKP